MNREELLDLLDRAKDAYYNSDEEILSDAEFDEIERMLGLENNNYVGSDKGNYDVKHAFIMGSLAKTQVKEDTKTGMVNWDECADSIESFLRKANGAKYYETTPKLDGCSFSLEFKKRGNKAYLETGATRGNGRWGSDIKSWIERDVINRDEWSMINEAVNALCKDRNDILCIRGEVLIPLGTFSEKYSESYTMPRSLVAGVLGFKVEDASQEKLAMGKDLHFVCYDYRLFSKGKYQELSWMNPNDPTYNLLKPYLNHIGELPDKEYCQVHKFDGMFTEADLQEIYNDYDKYRREKCPYALDGIVFKPECGARKYNEDRPRPVDCIAMKFMPMINPTEVIDIKWKVGKTGEYFPTAILEPVKMPDGKTVNRASMHNYGWIIKNECGIGSKVRISLSGDIVPFVYEIVEHVPANDDNMHLPENTTINEDPNSGALHLMKIFNEDEEQQNKFLYSALTCNINTIGPAAAEELYEVMCDDIPELDNIIWLMNDKCYKMIYDRMGTGKSVQNIVNNMKQYAAHISLVDIIKSFNFKSCGVKASEVCARIISGLNYSTSSLPSEAYSWALDENSRQYFLVKKAMEELDVDVMEEEVSDVEQTPIIMTGDPSDCTKYSTKAKWLAAHPQYKETTSWKEVKILFTNDLESKTGKMQKATKLGIEIRQYDNDGDEAPKPQSHKETNNDFDFNNTPQQTSLELF